MTCWFRRTPGQGAVNLMRRFRDGGKPQKSRVVEGRKIMQNTCTLPNMSKRSMIVDRLDR